MKVEKIELSETDCFSSSFLEYLNPNHKLHPFYNRFPTIDNFKDQISEKNFPESNREILVKVLKDQYKSLEISAATSQNIESLGSEKTFTITTGHQLNIFTGPLYFIYKIVTVINICRDLKNKYPDYNFVPVYWMASEDHDFDEISYFRFQGQKYEWKSEQTGAVGRFDPREIKSLLETFPAKVPLFEKAYLDHNKLADSVRYYVNELFKEEGLVVIDSDEPQLKSLFAPVIEEDLFSHTPLAKVSNQNDELEKVGLKAQVHPREINFFYLENGLRTRIEKDGDNYILVDGDKTFTNEEIRDLISKHPERFSPNVILRPLYQEMILPNLAYIGGPAEVVYWLQLKGVFDHFNIPFPILMPRNFSLVIPEHLKRKWSKTGFKTIDLFKQSHELARELTLAHSENELLLNGKSDNVENTFDTIRKQAEQIDSTLGPMVGAEAKRALNSLEKIEKKMIRAEKRRMSDKIGQVESVRESLFPGNGLQERKDNFLNFYLDDKDFIKSLLTEFDPFDFRFYVMSYE